MLGENILKLRKKNGLSQEQLGEKINVTRQTISNWELGETAPNPEQLKLLSQSLNISIDELLDNDINSRMKEKIINIENLKNLDLCGDELFTFVCLPIKIENSDGAPARAIAIIEE